MNILRTFTMFMKKKYDTIQVDSDSVKRMLLRSKKHILQEAKDTLDDPITMDELHIAVKQGKNHKAPGCDGISHNFFQLTWETTQYDMLEIMNQMFMDEKLMDSQKHGIIICPKKYLGLPNPEDYRPLTLLNADFKMLARIIADRISPWINDLLHPSQHCGVQDNNTLGPSPPSGTPLLRLK